MNTDIAEIYAFVTKELENANDFAFDADEDHHEFMQGMCKAFQTVLNLLDTCYSTTEESSEASSQLVKVWVALYDHCDVRHVVCWHCHHE